MRTSTKVRALRRIINEVERQLAQLDDDPISRHYGVTPPPPRWPQKRIAAALLQLRLSRADAVAELSEYAKLEHPPGRTDTPDAWYELLLLEDC